jgi:hypothetical protein
MHAARQPWSWLIFDVSQKHYMKPSPPATTPETRDEIETRNNWLRIVLALGFSGVLIYRLATAPFSIDLTGFNFNDLLALLLALFSIGLSVAFYFKATDTSNEFYDNTYRFTKDISEILGRIEAGFGERLKHLDEGYSGLRDKFEKMPFDKGKVEKELKAEEEQAQRVEMEKAKLLEDLARRAKLQEEEKKILFQQLAEKDSEVAKTRAEIEFFRRRLERAEIQRGTTLEELPSRLLSFIKEQVIPALGGDVAMGMPRSLLRRRFSEIRDKFPPGFLDEARAHGLVDDDNDLTMRGTMVISAATRRRENG